MQFTKFIQLLILKYQFPYYLRLMILLLCQIKAPLKYHDFFYKSTTSICISKTVKKEQTMKSALI